jgi:hypothetical protein
MSRNVSGICANLLTVEIGSDLYLHDCVDIASGEAEVNATCLDALLDVYYHSRRGREGQKA